MLVGAWLVGALLVVKKHDFTAFPNVIAANGTWQKNSDRLRSAEGC
ncbi:hypothetical protein [Scytonema sp. PCC 10023]